MSETRLEYFSIGPQTYSIGLDGTKTFIEVKEVDSITCPHCGKPGYHHIELGSRGKTERGTFDMTPEYKCRSQPKDADNG